MPKITKLSFKHISAVFQLNTDITITPSFAPIRHGSLTRCTEIDGLLGIQMNDLLQDKFLYLWVGTSNYLARYNENEFNRFCNNPTYYTLIKSLIFWPLYEDRTLIGTSPENLNNYSPVTKSFRHFSYKQHD